MFNLIVKFNGWTDSHDSISAGRVFEYTDRHMVDQFKPNGQLNFQMLITLPTLFVQEGMIQGRSPIPFCQYLLDYTIASR